MIVKKAAMLIIIYNMKIIKSCNDKIYLIFFTY